MARRAACLRSHAATAIVLPLLATADVSLANAQQLSATLNVTNVQTHVGRTAVTGSTFIESPYTTEQMFKLVAGETVFLKVDGQEFGIRWDLQTHDPGHKTFYANYFQEKGLPLGYDGTYKRPRTFHQQLKFALQNNVTLIIIQPTPSFLTAPGVPSSGEASEGIRPGFWWQTDDFYAKQVQYVLGNADPDWAAQIDAKRAAGVATGTGQLTAMDTRDSRNAGFNWANLRAARGQVAPFPNVYGFTMGHEPYWAEGVEDAQYPQIVNRRTALIKAVVPSARLGVFTQLGDEAWNDELWKSGTGIVVSRIDFVCMRHYYVGIGNTNWPADEPFWLGGFNAIDANPGTSGAFNADGTRHMFRGYRIPNVGGAGFYRAHQNQMIDKYGLPQAWKDNLVMTEWGYGVVSPAGQFGDLGNAISRAGFMADAMKADFRAVGVWLLGNEPAMTFGLVNRVRHLPSGNGQDIIRTPSFHAKGMLDEAAFGKGVFQSTITSPSYTHTPAVTPVNVVKSASAVRINYVDAWVFGQGSERWIYAVNRHRTSDIQLAVTGLAGYVPVEHKQLGGRGFGIHDDNQTVPDKVVPRNVAVRSPIVLEPLSINVIRLAQGSPPPAPGAIWGDVTKDGRVNSSDALGTLSYTVGLPNPAQDYRYADVNADNQVTTLDALIDIYYAVGLDVSGYRVGRPVTGGNGDIVILPQAARATRSPEARVLVGLARTAVAERAPGGAGVRVAVRTERREVTEEIGAFQIRLRWDPQQLRFRSAEAPAGRGSLLLGVNEAEAAAGALSVAGASPEALGDDLVVVLFDRVTAGAAEDDLGLELEVLGLAAAGTAEDLTPAVEVRLYEVGGAPNAQPRDGKTLGLPYPNPSPGRMSIPLHIENDGTVGLAGQEAVHVELNVYDLRGRRVKRLLDGELLPGDEQVEWDGTDEGGRRVPAGIYVVEFRAPAKREIRKVVIY